LSSQLVPGSYVRHPDRPDWGVGQVQTVVGSRITVNFENAGKQLINVAIVALIEIDPDVDGRA
jgi:transcription elongation factor GreA-like protein